jgi:hypothetical protein
MSRTMRTVSTAVPMISAHMLGITATHLVPLMVPEALMSHYGMESSTVAAPVQRMTFMRGAHTLRIGPIG